MLFVFFSDILAILSYEFANRFYKNNFNSAMEMFMYSNIFILPMLFFMFRKTLSISMFIKNLKTIKATFTSVLSSFTKTYIVSGAMILSQLQLKSFSLLCPFITLILCAKFSKEKLQKNFLLKLLFVFIGFTIFNKNFNFNVNLTKASIVAICVYVFLNSYSDFKLKQIGTTRQKEMIFFDNIMYCLIGCLVWCFAFFNETASITIFKTGKFTLSKVFNKDILSLFTLSCVSFFAHNLKMLSYKTKHITHLLSFIFFFKSFNVVIVDIILRQQLPSGSNIIGLVVMFLTILTLNKQK